MPTYIGLLSFTEDGLASIEELPSRDDDGRALLADHGVELLEHYYTLGAHDEVIVCEAPDDQTMARGMLAIGREGNVTTETLRAFDEEAFHELVGDLGAD